MRLAVFSDIHGNDIAFQAALNDYERLGGADQVWFLGDLIAFGARPAECIRRLKALGERFNPPADEAKPADAPPWAKGTSKFRAIRGNTDRYLINGDRPHSKSADDAEKFEKMRSQVMGRDMMLNWALGKLDFEDYDFLRKMGSECDLFVEGFGYVIGYHGTPGDDNAYLRPDTSEDEAADFFMEREGHLGIGGHIHVQMDRTLQYNGWRVVNVGSVGMSFDKPGYAQWGMFTFEGSEVAVDLRAVPYDVDAAIADLHDAGYPLPDWSAERLRNGMK